MDKITPYTATDLINWVPAVDTKEKLAKTAEMLTEAVTEGRVDPIQAAVAFDALSKIMKTAIEQINGLVLTEIGKYHKQEKITVGRVEIREKEAGTRYDYSDTGDPIWTRLMEIKTANDKALKERETFLQSLSRSITVVDEETGEVYKIYPPVKKSTTTYALFYPKD